MKLGENTGNLDHSQRSVFMVLMVLNSFSCVLLSWKQKWILAVYQITNKVVPSSFVWDPVRVHSDVDLMLTNGGPPLIRICYKPILWQDYFQGILSWVSDKPLSWPDFSAILTSTDYKPDRKNETSNIANCWFLISGGCRGAPCVNLNGIECKTWMRQWNML